MTLNRLMRILLVEELHRVPSGTIPDNIVVVVRGEDGDHDVAAAHVRTEDGQVKAILDLGQPRRR